MIAVVRRREARLGARDRGEGAAVGPVMVQVYVSGSRDPGSVAVALKFTGPPSGAPAGTEKAVIVGGTFSTFRLKLVVGRQPAGVGCGDGHRRVTGPSGGV